MNIHFVTGPPREAYTGICFPILLPLQLKKVPNPPPHPDTYLPTHKIWEKRVKIFWIWLVGISVPLLYPETRKTKTSLFFMQYYHHHIHYLYYIALHGKQQTCSSLSIVFIFCFLNSTILSITSPFSSLPTHCTTLHVAISLFSRLVEKGISWVTQNLWLKHWCRSHGSEKLIKSLNNLNHLVLGLVYKDMREFSNTVMNPGQH